jgi:hypothetical protein
VPVDQPRLGIEKERFRTRLDKVVLALKSVSPATIISILPGDPDTMRRYQSGIQGSDQPSVFGKGNHT